MPSWILIEDLDLPARAYNVLKRERVEPADETGKQVSKMTSSACGTWATQASKR